MGRLRSLWEVEAGWRKSVTRVGLLSVGSVTPLPVCALCIWRCQLSASCSCRQACSCACLLTMTDFYPPGIIGPSFHEPWCLTTAIEKWLIPIMHRVPAPVLEEVCCGQC